MLVEWIRDGHPTNLGAASGIVAGLVAITPAAGYVSGMGPIFIGLIAGVVCCYAVKLKSKAGYDDALDVVGVHFVGGLVGSLLIGFFANPEFFGGASFCDVGAPASTSFGAPHFAHPERASTALKSHQRPAPRMGERFPKRVDALTRA